MEPRLTLGSLDVVTFPADSVHSDHSADLLKLQDVTDSPSRRYSPEMILNQDFSNGQIRIEEQ